MSAPVQVRVLWFLQSLSPSFSLRMYPTPPPAPPDLFLQSGSSLHCWSIRIFKHSAADGEK